MGSGSKRSRRADDSDSISKEETSISGEETDVDSEMESEENDIPQNLVQKDDELEELEKEYSNLQNQQQDLLVSLKRHKDEDLLKGQAVKNQKGGAMREGFIHCGIGILPPTAPDVKWNLNLFLPSLPNEAKLSLL
ncbi:hypothetical protein ACLOJK_040765 [Asimina triloba]